MLSLTRRPGQYLLIGDDIVIHTVWIKGNQVRVAIEAPDHVNIVRGELLPRDASWSQEPRSSRRYQE